MNYTSTLFTFHQKLAGLSLAAVLMAAVSSAGQPIHVSITNEGNSDFFLTPLWFSLHDGSLDTFNAGEAASMAIETLAEAGDSGGLRTQFAGAVQAVAANAAGFGGAAIIDPGETAMASLQIPDPASHRYLSFASMVIPSNDAFLGNDDPMAHEVFDASGNYLGPLTIQIFGNGIWDAGTEVNNTMGAAFSAVGGTGTDEGGFVMPLAAGGLDGFSGTGIPTGNTIADLIEPAELLATIHVTQVPEPHSGAMVAVVLLVTSWLRRRRRT